MKNEPSFCATEGNCKLLKGYVFSKINREGVENFPTAFHLWDIAIEFNFFSSVD